MTNKEIYEWFLSLKNEGITREELATRAKLTQSTIGEFIRKYKLFLSGELDRDGKQYKEPGLKHDNFMALQAAYNEIKFEKQSFPLKAEKPTSVLSDINATEILKPNDSVDALRLLYRRSTPSVKRAFLASLLEDDDHTASDFLKKTIGL